MEPPESFVRTDEAGWNQLRNARWNLTDSPPQWWSCGTVFLAPVLLALGEKARYARMPPTARHRITWIVWTMRNSYQKTGSAERTLVGHGTQPTLPDRPIINS